MADSHPDTGGRYVCSGSAVPGHRLTTRIRSRTAAGSDRPLRGGSLTNDVRTRREGGGQRTRSHQFRADGRMLPHHAWKVPDGERAPASPHAWWWGTVRRLTAHRPGSPPGPRIGAPGQRLGVGGPHHRLSGTRIRRSGAIWRVERTRRNSAGEQPERACVARDGSRGTKEPRQPAPAFAATAATARRNSIQYAKMLRSAPRSG